LLIAPGFGRDAVDAAFVDGVAADHDVAGRLGEEVSEPTTLRIELADFVTFILARNTLDHSGYVAHTLTLNPVIVLSTI
jgi:hypothetical protein